MVVDIWVKEEIYFTYTPVNDSDWNPLDKESLLKARPHCRDLEEARKALPYFTKTFSESLIDPKNKELKITRVSIKTIYEEKTALE